MTTQQHSSEGVLSGTNVISARAGRYYRNTRYLLAAMILGMGLWFAYDGYVAWPAHNVKLDQLTAERKEADDAGNTSKVSELSGQIIKMGDRKTPKDIGLQRVLGWTLPPLGVALLAWALWRSRGAFRLEQGVLQAPGHPPVPLEKMTNIDRRLWERKGIAVVHYELDGRAGQITLDDFVYDRKPIDAIHDVITRRLEPDSLKK